MDIVNIKDAGDENTTNFDKFDIDGFTQEEIESYNSIAEPGQKLGGVVTPQQTRDMM